MNVDLLTFLILAFSSIVFVMIETNVAFVILALTSGYVLNDTIGPQIFDYFSNSIDPDKFPLFVTVQLVLLFLPAVLIAHRFRRSQRGPGRFIQQLVPAFALSLLIVVFVFEILPESANSILEDESYIHSNLSALRGWIIGFAIAAALFDILIQHAGPPRKYKKRSRLFGMFKKD